MVQACSERECSKWCAYKRSENWDGKGRDQEIW